MKNIIRIICLSLVLCMCSSYALAVDMPQVVFASDRDSEVVSEIYLEDESLIPEEYDGVVITPVDVETEKNVQNTAVSAVNGKEDVTGLVASVNKYLVDINHTEITADDFEIVDAFNTDVSGSYSDYFSTPGNYLNIDYNQYYLADNKMLLLLYSLDGANWSLVPSDYVTRNADGTITVRMEQTGMFSLAASTNAKAAEAFQAISYTLAPTAAPTVAPVIVEPTKIPSPGKGGTTKVIGAVDSSGNAVTTTTVADEPVRLDKNDEYVVVTPMEKAENAPTEKITTELTDAKENIQLSYSAAELLNTDGNSIKDELDSRLAEIGRDDLSAEDMVVMDVFHVLGSVRYEAFLEIEGNYIEATYQELGLEPDQAAILLFSEDGGHWSVYPEEYVTRNADGTITARVYTFGSFSIVVEAVEEED